MQSYSSWDGQFPVRRKEGEKWKFKARPSPFLEEGKGREGVRGDT